MNLGTITTDDATVTIPKADYERLLKAARGPESVMVCKLQLHYCEVAQGKGTDQNNQLTLPVARVRMGGVWEGSTEKQQASENAIFGHWTPHAEFNATIMNQNVIDKLKADKKYYLTFVEAPD